MKYKGLEKEIELDLKSGLLVEVTISMEGNADREQYEICDYEYTVKFSEPKQFMYSADIEEIDKRVAKYVEDVDLHDDLNDYFTAEWEAAHG